MSGQAFADANAFHRVMRRFAATTVGVAPWHTTARLAAPDERDEIWAKGLELYPGWRKYEVRAGMRHIEAFVLPRG